jgi:hypothetical protein
LANCIEIISPKACGADVFLTQMATRCGRKSMNEQRQEKAN